MKTHPELLVHKTCALKFIFESDLGEFVMHPSALQHASSYSVWQRCHLAKGCWVTWGQAKGLWKLSCLNRWCTVALQIIIFTKLCLICTHTRVKLPHLSLISECLNLRCRVERLPTDTQHRIKSFTVESKEFSVFLHKHESNGGGGLHLEWASSYTPSSSCTFNCVLSKSDAFWTKKVTVIYFTLHLSRTIYYNIRKCYITLLL